MSQNTYLVKHSTNISFVLQTIEMKVVWRKLEGVKEKRKHVMMKDRVKGLCINSVKLFHPELQTASSAQSPVTAAH